MSYRVGGHCENCGCRIGRHGCENCHEEAYILDQYRDQEMADPSPGFVEKADGQKLEHERRLALTPAPERRKS